ncbi:haloalkane dehalogenase [Christensenellaceae bacterium]|nr:haloalkane dehalogenase [Christensenellaceae bacterium]BDF60328.1 haloalkane dehalogenase [Christensenellaceae bacterium]
MEVKISEVRANGYTFRCRSCGMENSGDLVVFLHGFPESSIMWQTLMLRLAEMGYRCFAPDQRGFSAGARPEGLEHYTHKKLLTDVLEMTGTLKHADRFHLVGHDWGAIVGWNIVMTAPKKVISFTAMAVPHTAAFSYCVANDEQQHRLSQYIFEYAPEDEPEERLGANECAFLKKAKWDGFDSSLIDEYMTIFGKKEGLTATLAWYRSCLLHLKTHEENRMPDNLEVRTPTLLLYGRYDPAVGNRACDMTEQYMKGYYRFVPMRCGHWMIENNEEECTKEIVNHIEKFSSERK